MKTTNWLALISVFTFSLLSCNVDTIVQAEKNSNAKIKRQLFYNYIEDKVPIRTYEFLYDKEQRLDKIYQYIQDNTSSAYGYELFEYNIENKDVKRFTYHYANDLTGWILHDSTYYTYSNGKLINEETFYFTPSSDHIVYKYEYENSKLLRKSKYYNQQFDNYTLFDYSTDHCVKETTFSDSLGLNIVVYINHNYDNGKLSKSERFLGNNNIIQIITYIYDDNGNLIIEEAKQTDFTVVKPLYYVIRYEYY